MTQPLAAAAFVLLFALVTLAADALRPGRAGWPVGVAAGLLGLLFLELTRYDLGQGEAYFTVAFVVAPVAFIFAASLWAVRRFHGWPDLGPHPGRLAVLCLGVLVGVIVGHGLRRQDVEESLRRARIAARAVLAWRAEHEGRWPEALADALGEVPRSRMGVLAPPPLRLVRAEAGASADICFAISTRRALCLDVASEEIREVAR